MASSDDLILPPGSDQGAAILGQAALEAKFEAALRAGIYCAGCGQAIDEPGWEYFSVRTEVRDGEPKVVSAIAYICNRECCTEARAQLEKSAAARRPWAPWHIFYVEAPDAPPPDADAAPEEPEPEKT